MQEAIETVESALSVKSYEVVAKGDAVAEAAPVETPQQIEAELKAAGIEEIKTLREQLAFAPVNGRYKVYIIDEVHMLTTEAFNALLKTLEEPPAHVIFILATTEAHKIPVTIMSRCQRYDFKRISIDTICERLNELIEKEGLDVEERAVRYIAKMADGAMRDALSIFDQVVSFCGNKITYQGVISNLNVLDYDYYFRFTDLFIEHKISETMLLFDEVLRRGFDGGNFITNLTAHLRDLLVSREEATLPLLEVSHDVRERYREQAQKCNERFLIHAIKLCNDCDLNYRVSKNKRLLRIPDIGADMYRISAFFQQKCAGKT